MTKKIRHGLKQSRNPYTYIVGGGLLVYFSTLFFSPFRIDTLQNEMVRFDTHKTDLSRRSNQELDKVELNTTIRTPKNSQQTISLIPKKDSKILLLPSYNFGFCRAMRNFTIQRIDPHKVEYGSKIIVEPQYRVDFWGSVDFKPVPAFQMNTHDPDAQDVFISGSVHRSQSPWDPFIWNLFVNVLSDSQHTAIVVDVGANLGYFSLLAASMGFNVISFEPMNRNVAKFMSSVVRNGFENRITLYQNAVTYTSGDSVKMIETHATNQGNGQMNKLDALSNGIYGQGYVNTIRIDDVIDTNVLLMKIDVEGFESGVLNGAKRLMCWNIVNYITIEFSLETRQSAECPALSMLQLVETLGYEISDIVPNAPPLKSRDFENFPPNILFRLLNSSVAPAYRLGPKSVCH